MTLFLEYDWIGYYSLIVMLGDPDVSCETGKVVTYILQTQPQLLPSYIYLPYKRGFVLILRRILKTIGTYCNK